MTAATTDSTGAGDQRTTLGFQTEVRELLQLMIHSLYSNREIFLRELISNASDACDKLRFEALHKSDLYEGDSELKIKISTDADGKTITISDNGIGMNREEAIANLGTIAKSGTREFFSRLTGDQKKDAQLIGQFGVGFYSSFIVADKVTVLTRRAGTPADEGVRWESTGSGEFTIEPAPKSLRGTEITLHLKTDAADLASGWKLRSLIRKYSDHIMQPILMKKEEWDAETKQQKLTDEEETVNRAAALWTRPKQEISDDEYKEFYKHVSHDHDEPLAWAHARVEGKLEYTQLLYIPSHAPFDLWDRQVRHGIKLYVRRVFIMDDAEQLLPFYLRFVRGIVDASDLPLNISREILQESRDIEAIRAGCARRVLGMIEELAADTEKYAKFWTQFGRVLKEGVGTDAANKERIAKLLRFATTQTDSPEQTVALDEYIARMKDGQKAIYYVTAETFNGAKNSPHLEVFRKKGIEVLLLTDQVDEWVVGSLHEYAEKPLESVAKGALDLGDLADKEELAKQEQAAGTLKELTEKIAKSLGDKVQEVRVTHRLTSSPACLVSADGALSSNLLRILKTAGQQAPENKPILEINPTHPIVLRLKTEVARFDDWALVLFDQALLAEGGQLDDPAGFVHRVNSLMLALSLGG